MKRIIMLFVAIVAVATSTSVQAQEETETIQFVNQIGCLITYQTAELADIITTCDTLIEDEDNELARLMAEYERVFPSDLGPYEPAVAVLLPDDDYFNVIFLQEDEDGEILTLWISSEDGWLQCVAKPGDENLLSLASKIAIIQKTDAVMSR